MRKVTIQEFCDICASQTAGDVLTPSTTTLYFATKPDELPVMQLDVCEDHWSSYSIDVLIEATRPIELEDDRPPLSKRGRPKGPCPVCGKDYALGSGMSLHIKHQHPEHKEELPAASYSHEKHDTKKRKKAR